MRKLVVALFLLLATGARVRAEAPSVELAALTPADGFSVSLFAAEDLGIANPVQMRWDENGRLYVLCTWIYPQIRPGEKPADKIFILEDRNGDGVADRSTLFADGLDAPLGLELGDGGVYVGQGPDLLHFRDTNGDGKADVRRVVLTGFGTGDTHHTISNFVWSPEGDLNMLQGYHVDSNVETPHGVRRLKTAGIWRLRPSTLDLKGYIGAELPPHNPWGIAYDPWGRSIVVAGNGHGIYDTTAMMVNSDRAVPLASIAGTTKFAGVEFLDGRHMPESVNGQIVTGAFLFNAVARYAVKWEGSAFRLEELQPLLSSTHKSFRPVDVKMGPDGALYVADFYNPIISHYGSSLRHPDRDKTHGRIWRVTANKRPLLKRPSFKGDISSLLTQLSSTERWTRYQARRLLRDRGAKAVVPELDRWVQSLSSGQADLERLLVEAAGMYATLDTPRPELVQRLSVAQDPRARAYGARLLGRWSAKITDPVAMLSRLAADVDSRVRLEAVVAAASFGEKSAIEAAARVLDHPRDSFIDHALARTTSALKPYWKPALLRKQLTFDGRTDRLAFIMAADATRDALLSLQQLVRSGKMDRDLHGRVLEALTGVGGPSEWRLILLPETFKRKDARGGYDVDLHARLLGKLVEIARVREQMPALASAFKPLLTKLLKSNDPRLAASAISLAAVWLVTSMADDINKVASDARAPIPVRTAAVAALRDLDKTRSAAWLSALIATSHPREVRAAAITTMLRFDRPAAARAAAALLAERDEKRVFDPTPLLAGFLTRKGASAELAAELKKTPPGPDVAILCHRMLTASGHNAPELMAVLGEALGLALAVPEYDPVLVKELAKQAEKSGDAERGEKIYWSTLTNCSACHAIGGAGGFLGPDLSAVGTGLSMEIIVESVLWPARQVKEGFLSVTVNTRDDRVFQGYKVSDDAEKIVLRDAASGLQQTIARRDVTTVEEAGTLMPEGLTGSLTRTELLDLLGFLGKIGRPGPLRISADSVLRRRRVSPLPEAVSSDANAPLPESLSIDSGTPAYSRVNGVLRNETVKQLVPAGLALVAAEVDVLKDGKFIVNAEGIPGVRLFLDRQPVAAGATVPMSAGRHTVFAILNPAKDGTGLHITLKNAPDSAGELRLVGGL